MEKFYISDSEASSLKEFIEFYFIESIRNDEEVDSLLYIYNILNIYKRLGGMEQYVDYEFDNQ
jgi:hypothetical protein